ncbi:protein ABHD1-like isoform X2 [Adelges cooleyi]|uniref:protein ABHD1-like isoform X2 n=1 Tax=Adelges cooleyi TaxID=133065 RepID=UPI00218000F5|nr:protein ABHD1-like isoform X2 [Adelges cooleyi]
MGSVNKHFLIKPHLVQKPFTDLYSKDGDFKQFLFKNVPIINEKYSPTFWAFNGHTQTIVATFLRDIVVPKVKYNREILTLKDGGQVAIDWRNPNEENNLMTSSVTVLLLCGLTGHSQSEYIKETVNELYNWGYCTVVFNYRGLGGVKLKTARSYSANNIEDLTEVLKYIKLKRPLSPVAAIGFSMGGLLLGTFLTSREQAVNKYLATGVLLSVPWNVTKASYNTESSWLMRRMGEYLSYHLRNIIVQNKDVIFNGDNNTPLDYNRIIQCKTIRQFDTEYTIKMFNYKDVYDYYNDASLSDKLHLIQIPCLCLSAADDPFLYLPDIPVHEAEKLSNLAILVTSGGGHIGYLDTFWPFRNNNYMLQLIQQYFAAIMVDKNYEKFSPQIQTNNTDRTTLKLLDQ